MPTWAIIAIIGGAFLVLGVVIVVVAARSKPAGPPALMCGGCGRTMMPNWPQCFFCGWKPAPPVGFVEFINGPLGGQRMTLEMDLVTIGSVPGNSIVLMDPAVSKKHAGIRRAPEGYELADLGSTNGVYVNGQRTAKRVLVPGDVIRVGQSEMVFRVGAR
jgi:hypothetical protein